MITIYEQGGYGREGRRKRGRGMVEGGSVGGGQGRMVEGTEKGVDEGRDKGVVIDQRN